MPLKEATQKQTHSSLVRQLTFPSLFFIVVANMVGVGIFTTSGLIIRQVQHPLVMLSSWIIGGIFALCGALCYGELGAMFPMAGGEYVFLRETFGKKVAFLSGWVSLLVGFSAPLAAVAMAFSVYLNSALSLELTHNVIQAITVGAILCTALIHCCGLKGGVRTQNILTILKILLILSMIVGGFLWGRGSFAHFKGEFIWQDFLSLNFAMSLLFVYFAYSGWNASAYLGEEIQNPGKNIPFSIISGTICVMVCYLLLNIIFIYAVPAGEMSGIEDVGRLSAQRLFGEKIGRFYSLAIALQLLSTLGALTMTGPRVYYAMAKDRVLFQLFGKVHQTRKIPIYSILLQVVISVVMVLTTSFEWLLLYVGFVLSIFSTLTVSAVIFLRITRPDLKRPYKTWGYPWTPLVFILGNLWIVWWSLRSNFSAFLVGGITVIIGLVLYHFLEWFHYSCRGNDL